VNHDANAEPTSVPTKIAAPRAIAYQDFAPQKERGGLASHPFESVVAAANGWLSASRDIRVVGVGTLFAIKGNPTSTTSSETGIRVWYMSQSNS